MNIQLRELRKSYDGIAVLDGISASFDSGFYGLCGTSGGGKTTLLRIICGLLAPDSGSVTFSGDPTFSYAFQEPRLFPSLTVRQNVTLISPERDPDELLLALDLTNAAALYPDELSGGMKTRAGIARCLSKQADVYLLDEPTGGQDPQHADAIVQAIRKYAHNAVCITVSHDAGLLTSCCEHILTLSSGKLTSATP